MTTDYRATVFLPKTSFPMRASLPTREPELLERWQRLDIYGRLRAAAAGRDKFILHDGPPYANGHLHMGTALNKILKDVVNRSQQMLGKDAVYVPGWDCHGLPIEWQIEQRYRQAGKDKDAVPIAEFRRECREFAEHWIDVQRSEFKRLGVVGDWDHPYTTMEHQAEAGIYRELGKFLLSGQLYRGKKSVMWSVVEKTALAEAEVEYRDHTSTTIVVRFPVVEPAHPALAGASVLIWTTTPWTMPGNRAVAYGEDIEYRVIEVTAVAEGSLARVGERLVLAGAPGRSGGRTGADQRPSHGRRPHGPRSRRHGPAPSACAARATTSRCRCSPGISSAPRKARASCTSRPRTAPTISSSAPGMASRCPTRSPRTAATRTRCRCSPASTCSRRPSR